MVEKHSRCQVKYTRQIALAKLLQKDHWDYTAVHVKRLKGALRTLRFPSNLACAKPLAIVLIELRTRHDAIWHAAGRGTMDA